MHIFVLNKTDNTIYNIILFVKIYSPPDDITGNIFIKIRNIMVINQEVLDYITFIKYMNLIISVLKKFHTAWLEKDL